MDKSILLVDDEEGIRKVSSILLEDMGYQVHTAATGVEALRTFEKLRPPIVLTDIKMPEMDGIELLRKLKQISPDTEVIMITGHGDMDLAIKSVKYEATDFVTKPINDEVLEIAVKRAHERITMRRKLDDYTHNLEQLVRDKTKKLVEAERLAAIGQTVAGLSHAIKNITGGLKGGAFVLEKGIELGEQKYLLQGWEMIKGNVDKITNLSLDLLNYAKDTRPDFQECDPNQPLREVVALMRPRAQEHGIDLSTQLGKDPAIQKIFEIIPVLAASDATILIEGPTGTGKDVLAKVIHNASSRSPKPLIKVNCAALSDNLLESEMFGYVKGAFTGADNDKPGRFQEADRGTIFLDEIGDLPLSLQAKLLRVLEDREFYPLGSRKTTKVDVRIISATNQNLR